MRAKPIDLSTGEPIPFDPDTIETFVSPPGIRQFRINYLKILDMQIDTQWARLDRYEALTAKAAGIREAIAEIRSDPEDDGMTLNERHQIHQLREQFRHVDDRIDAMPDYDAMSHHLMNMTMDFIHKSDEWNLHI